MTGVQTCALPILNLLMPPGADCHYPDVALSLVDANLILPFYALNQNLCMGHVTFPTRLAPISVHGLPTLLTIFPLLRVDLRVAMLRTS